MPNMYEEKPTELEVENQAGTETSETTDVDGSKQPETSTTDESPYAKQLEEFRKKEEALKAELKVKEDLLTNKNRAIESLKKKTQDVPDEDALADRLLRKMDERNVERDIQSKIASLTSDSAEREVILRHYQSSIVRTGNVEEDLKNAIALANRDVVWEQRRNRALEERREDFITSFAGTSLRGDTGSSRTNDPIMAQTEALLRSINPEAIKHLKKQ